VVVRDPAGRPVTELGEAIGVNTNQVAEYEGLIRALRELREAGAVRARVFTDSEFVVKQFSGIYKARDERMKALLARVRALQKDFESLEIVHVRRSSHPQNVRVDALANEALDRAARGDAGRAPSGLRPRS
jgi:ribonuclease H / adenosylcobalamin/alpha-ribazole phosphatase